ncbi:MAG: glycerol dehydrogenase [Armatimonadetes bacterium]|nr:glycerol dehydrogenase [Armatimonadota bacterium]
MKRSIVGPWRFVCGAGVLQEIGHHAAALGSRALLMGGSTALELTSPTIHAALEAKGVAWHEERGGHVTKRREAVDALIAVGRDQGVDLTIAVGAGRVGDAAKAVARTLNVPLITCPTLAASNGPGTFSAGIEGDAQRSVWYRGPDLLIADTEVIIRGGPRWLNSGMGDCLPFGAMWEMTERLGRTTGADYVLGLSNCYPTLASQALAKLTYDTILEYGEEAHRAAERGIVNEAFDKVVEAVVYCSVMAVTACGGVGHDHGYHPGNFSCCSKELYHGEGVAFGALVNVILFRWERERVLRQLRFTRSVGLPTTFADFDLPDITPEQVREECRRMIGEGSEPRFGLPWPISADMVAEAMLEIDYLGGTLP